MGAVSFSISRDLVEAAAKELPFEAFVETGTFEGDAVAAVADLFPEIHSVELSTVHFEKARARFDGMANVRLAQGGSVEFLRAMAPGLRDRSVLFYLDAHWCAAEGSAGEKSQCPLLDEIRAIGTLGERSLILIDDARLFLATPPEPHEVSNWPPFDAVDRALRALSGKHELMVVNDVIVFHPVSVAAAMRRYARHHGVDWLRARQSLQENLDLRATLEGKEEEIHRLHAVTQQRERVIREQEAELTRFRLASLAQAAPADLSAVSGDLQAELVKRLEQKQAVIEELHRAVAAYRAVFGPFGFIIRPAARLFGFLTRPIRLFVPRLGVLSQHPPIDLRRPPVYASAAGRNRPRISIVTPSFRQAAYIERTIESVVGQGYPNLEYFVQDGGSEDGTREILERYADRLAGWDSRPDGGQSEAINRGFARTAGEIMAWLNSDDILFPGALDCVADYFESHPEVDVVYGNRVLIDEDDREIGRWVMPAHDDRILSWADYVPQETLFWRRRIWERAGGRVDESFRFAMDWDLLVRFREAGARFARIPRFLGGFRIHSRQKTSAGISSVGFREMDRIRERVLGHVPNRAELRKAVTPYLLRHVAADLAWRVRFRLGIA